MAKMSETKPDTPRILEDTLLDKLFVPVLIVMFGIMMYLSYIR